MIIVKVVVLLLIIGLSREDQDFFLGESVETGFIDVGRGKLFYWLFSPRYKKEDSPVLLWLQGGPGCSNGLALFYENGPFFINDDMTLRKNPYSWNNNSYTIYLEQPVGTGYSTVNRYVATEEQVAHDIYVFLNKLFDKHPEFAKNNFFISGESYAGHYIPALAQYILQQKDNKINLKGAAMGNGLVSAYYQYPSYSDYAYRMGNISSTLYTVTTFGFSICKALLAVDLWQFAMPICQITYFLIIGTPLKQYFNQYDVRRPCPNPPDCYNTSNLDPFYNNKTVRNLINTTGYPYVSYNYIVHAFLFVDWWFSYTDAIAYVLNTGKVDFMSYNGDMDFLCNWIGGERWAKNLNWKGKEEFNKAQYKNWIYDGKVQATYKVYDKFSFVVVKDVGHMVPMDNPKFSLELINKFMFEGIK